MTLLDVRPARQQGSGIQLYLRDRMVSDSAFPLDQGADTICHVIPDTAIILLPADDPPDYPAAFTAREPGPGDVDPGVDTANIGLHTAESGANDTIDTSGGRHGRRE